MPLWSRVAAVRGVKAAGASAVVQRAVLKAPAVVVREIAKSDFVDGRLVLPTSKLAPLVQPITPPPVLAPPPVPSIHTIPVAGFELPTISGTRQEPIYIGGTANLPAPQTTTTTIRRVGGAAIPSPMPAMETPDMNTGLNANRPVAVESAGGGGGGGAPYAPPVVNIAAPAPAASFDWKKWLPYIIAAVALLAYLSMRKGKG